MTFTPLLTDKTDGTDMDQGSVGGVGDHARHHNDLAAAVNELKKRAVSVKDFGAVGNNATNDTAAIQAALDACAAAGGGVVVLPPGKYITSASLRPTSGVGLVGLSPLQQASPDAVAAIYCYGGGVPVIAGDASADLVTIQNLALFGDPTASGSKGIYAADCGGWLIRDCFLSQFGDQGVHLEGGNDPTVENVWVENACMVRTGRTDHVGALHLNTNDAMVSKVRATASCSANHSGSGWIAGIVLDGENCFLTNCMGHISETGIVVKTSAGIAGHTLVGCRSDLNYTDGFRVRGALVTLEACWSFRDGQAANNTHDGFANVGPANSYVGCRAVAYAPDTNKIRYGFSDTNTQPSPLQTLYSGCRSLNAVSGPGLPP